MQLNRQYRLAARPQGLPKPTDWTVTEDAVPEPGEGELVVAVRYISLDPAMRGWMNDARSYVPPVPLGDVMRAGGLGEVVASRHPGFAVGTYVNGMFGVQQYARSDGRGVYPVDPDIAPLPVYLGALGMPGLTAYFGLLEIGQPAEGETVLVSAAAGAVGQVVGQIAKIKGCRTVGIAGGAEKCAFVKDELGFDDVIDYKKDDVRARVRETCPDRINVYFDNVGGDILDTALTWLARRARIVICGAISQYNATESMRGPSNYMTLLVDRARMEGFLVFDFAARYPEGIARLAAWRTEGKLKSREDIVEGLDAFPDALLKLFSGENFGKLVLRV